MEYETALTKAWLKLEQMVPKEEILVRLLADDYDVNVKKKEVFSVSCNVPAKAHIVILVLHYLIQKLQGLPVITGEWISFKDLAGGQGYYAAFKKRVVHPIIRKYGDNPKALLQVLDRFKAKRAQFPDISVVLETFDYVPMLITVEQADEEFGPGASVLFDKSIRDIFCTEDVVVLAEFVTASI